MRWLLQSVFDRDPKVDTIDAVDMHALIQQLQKDRKTYKLKSVSRRNLKVHI